MEPVASPRRIAIVLGPKVAGSAIAQDLRELGFEVPEDGERSDVPPPFDPKGSVELRRVLSEFRQRATGKSPGGSAEFFLHPGVSFWAERPELAAIGQALGFLVIAPPSRVLSVFSNKLSLLESAERLGIPTLVLSYEPMYTIREIEKLLLTRNQRFPVVLKAVRGGGGFGIYVIHEAGELERKVPLWLEEIRRHFGDPILFLERSLESVRHVTLPFARFRGGEVHYFPVVDSSLQSRHRKMAEFCPCEAVSAGAERKIREWSARLAESTGFVGVGSFEFLVDDSRIYLVEGLARLNTGFRLWARVAGVNAIEWQLAALDGRPPISRALPGGGMNAGLLTRIYAEDPVFQLPRPGKVIALNAERSRDFPGEAPGRVELSIALEKGAELKPEESGLVGSIFSGSRDRAHAVVLARAILEEIWIAGTLQTNERYLSELLAHPWIREGMFHAAFLDEEFIPAIRPPVDWARVFASVCLAPAIGGPDGVRQGEKWSVGDQWVKPDPGIVNWVKGPELVEGGLLGELKLPDGMTARVCALPTGSGNDRWQVRIGSWVLPVRRVSAEKPRKLARALALVPGRVHSILYREGAVVPAHEPILILESLGMLVPHSLPVHVRIRKWRVRPEERIPAGEDLADFDVVPET